MNATRPSKKQRELLSFIDGFIAGHGYGPSYREIMRALNYKSVSTVATHIDNLIAKGHLRKRDHSARSLEVCDAPERPFAATKPVTQAQEKWLVDLIAKHFTYLEENPERTSAEVDQLFVLVGALHILGFEDAARSYKARLHELTQKTSAANS